MKKTPEFKRRFTQLMGHPQHNDQQVMIGRCIDEESDVWRVHLADVEGIDVDGCYLVPHPDNPTTNIEKLIHFCEYSAHGAMGQVFIIEAVLQYAAQVIEKTKRIEDMTAEERAEAERAVVNPALWASIAAEAAEFFDRRTD